MNRKQFTFYRGFLDGIKRIRNKSARCDAYEAIINYALDGVEPDLDSLPESAALAFVMAKPNLDASRKKAEGASNKDTDKISEDAAKIPQGYGEDTAKKPEQEKEQEKEKEKEQMLRARARGGKRKDMKPNPEDVRACLEFLEGGA